MKLIIVIITLAITRSSGEVRSYVILKGYAERYWTELVQNDVLYTPNQSENDQTIEFKKTVDNDDLMISATITRLTVTDEILIYDGKPLSVCAEAEPHSWDKFILAMFKAGIMASMNCPVKPGSYTINRTLPEITFERDQKVRCGDYKVEYKVVTGENEPVFKTLIIIFTMRQNGCARRGRDSV